MFIQGFYAINEKVIDKDLLKFNVTGDNAEFLKYYKTLDDYSIYYEILNNNNAKTSKQILTNIKNRKLLKRICEFSTSDLINNAIIGKQLMKCLLRILKIWQIKLPMNVTYNNMK